MSETVLGRSDEWLIRNINVLTPNDIAEQTGVAAEVALARAYEILDSVDVLQGQRLVAKLILQLQSMGNELEQRMQSAPVELVAGIANAAKGMFATVLKQLNESQRLAQDNVDSARVKYAAMFTEIVGRSFERSLNDLRAMYPDVPTEDIEQTFQRNLREVADQYELLQ